MPTLFQEQQLLYRLHRRDPEAFGQLYDAYVTPVYRFIYFKVSSRQDAEDLTSEVFLKTWQYITETDEHIENLRALLYKLARNLVVDFYRQRAKQAVAIDDEVLQFVPDSRQQSFLQQVDERIEMTSIEKVLRLMRDEYREVLILKYTEQLSISEIAHILDKSNGSVRVLLHRALRTAKELIKNNGKTLPPT